MHPLREVTPPGNGTVSKCVVSHWFFFSLLLALSKHVLVYTVIGAAHKQVRLSLIDCGCRSSRSQAIAGTWFQPLHVAALADC